MYNNFLLYFKRFSYNLGKKGSNLQPSDSESDALPVKLFPNKSYYLIKRNYREQDVSRGTRALEPAHNLPILSNNNQKELPGTGLEPAHLTALGSKPSMSTNSIIPAYSVSYIICGGRNWTCYLRVMSPTRYRFSTPQ